MRHRIWLLAILASVSVGASPLRAQALLPHTTRINFGNLEEQALNLAREAAQLAQFEQYDLALPRARLAAQLAPKAFQTQGILGSIYLRKEQYAEAITALKLAHNLKKDEPTILFSLGAAYLRNKNYPEAISNLKQGLTLEPKAATAMFDLGNAYFLTKRYDEAVTIYNDVLVIDNKFWAATNNIGLVEYERGNVDQAIAKWQNSLKQAEKIEFLAAEPTLALATAFYRKGDRTKAVELAVEAMKIDPRYGKIPHLVENLWGDRLIADVKVVLAQPQVKQILAESDLATRQVPIIRRN
ncbi:MULTISPECIES: tetratricopeptide repeat protein [Pseudanabaena]|uniref:tetratricopeptide repeat protein n=1 Tax=Pseudanabaena TaxID=1152 RepID=UPI0024798B79|nr:MULTISPECIES: tetratricopeptide repeat protein [Pseudanabaena]MEA5487372.1 tetratricopeptide repeat protein [Pseudanabaena sp. CCNP1317]WGS73192.1 tetratricopeptide repeat protein [Pseudanabaena galeata CCNP1313]